MQLSVQLAQCYLCGLQLLQSLPQWWDASQRAAALLTDPLTTPHLWYEDFMRIFPRLPLHGYGYWPKFLWGDIGMHLAPKEWNLLLLEVMYLLLRGQSPETLLMSDTPQELQKKREAKKQTASKKIGTTTLEMSIIQI